MSEITSRERVRNAIEHTANDRTPYNFRAEPEVYARIRNERNLPSDEQVRIWARSDVRNIGHIFSGGGYGGYSGFGWSDRVLPDGTQEDLWKVRRKRVRYDGGAYTDICHWPMKDASPAQIRAFDWPDPADVFDFSTLPAKVATLNRGNEYWCMIETESLFDRCWALRGMENFMVDLLAEPDTAEFLLTRLAEFFHKYTVMLLTAADGCIDAVGLYDDLGTQNGMMIGPETYRRFIQPRQKRLIETVKSYGVNVFYHCCGAIEPIISDLIEIGVDILDPVQMAAMRVEPEYLKDRYGRELTFHGGLDTQGFLATAQPDEIRRSVRHLTSTLGNGGGYILAGSHCYQMDIPVENMEAVHTAVIEEND